MGKAMTSYYQEQYKKDIGWQSAEPPYKDKKTAIKRLSELYGTARKGKVDDEGKLEKIWQELETISIPTDQSQYDQFAFDKIAQIAKILGRNNIYKIGIAQKIFNLFMKDLWAWGKLQSEQAKVIHLPLDRTILGKLKLPKCLSQWKSWTKVEYPEGKPTEIREQYIKIQETLRGYWQEIGLFGSPIEMEQFLWHRIAIQRD